jgi:predicted nucleic acid-binding protein
MSEAIYLDTNVFLDYFLKRRGSDTAYRILMRSLKCEYNIVVSDWLLKELHKYASPQETKTWLATLAAKNKIINIASTDADFEEARRIDEHFQDPLHAVLAHKAGAKILVTRNIWDFRSCRHLIKPVFPEDI